MAIKRIESDITVVEAARRRIQNVFRNGLPVYMSFSGGKDSLAMAGIVMDLIKEGRIDPSQLTVQFIDEEAIFECIDRTVKDWRRRFLMAGARFEWYCLEVKHFNCFNQLTNDESFICWDHTKQDVWIREPPPYAIRSHPKLKPREDTYQSFLAKRNKDGIAIVGVRAAESFQRLKYMSTMFASHSTMTARHQIFPIYDWKDTDVWKYLLDSHTDFPEVYLYLWQIGTSRRQLRVSQFFSVDTAKVLVNMNEYYPDLMEKICRREPNAYLASLYWDSDMFGRSTRGRRDLEKDEAPKDYKQMLIDVFRSGDAIFKTPHQKWVANSYRKMFLKVSNITDMSIFQRMYEALMAGDPKLRNLRAIYQKIFEVYNKQAKEEINES